MSGQKTKRQKDKKTKKTKKTKGHKKKTTKDKKAKTAKRDFNIVMSGQFRTLAMFFREAPFSVWSLTLKFGSLGKSKV